MSGSQENLVAFNTIAIDGGTIEYIPNYLAVIEEFQNRMASIKANISSAKKKLYIPIVQYPTYNAEVTLHSEDAVYNSILDLYENLNNWTCSIWDKGNPCIVDLQDYFVDTFYTVPSQSNYSDYNTSVNKASAILAENYQAIDELSDKEQSLINEGTRRLKQAVRAFQSSVYVVAPTIAALAANELAYADAKNQSERYMNETHYFNKQAFDLVISFRDNCAPKYVEQVFQTIEQFLSRLEAKVEKLSVSVTGNATEKKEWQAFQQKPCDPCSYVTLIKTCNTVTGLNKLMTVFGVDKKVVYARCLDVLKQSHFVVPLRDATEKLRKDHPRLISNLCQLQEISEESIFYSLVSMRSKSVARALETLRKKLPDDIKNKVIKKEQEHQVSEEFVATLVSRDDFLFLQEALGEEWANTVKQSTNIYGANDELYDLLVASVLKRISELRIYRERQEASLSKPKSTLKNLEQELAKCSIFSFNTKKRIRQQIEEIKKHISKINDDYNKSIQML